MVSNAVLYEGRQTKLVCLFGSGISSASEWQVIPDLYGNLSTATTHIYSSRLLLFPSGYLKPRLPKQLRLDDIDCNVLCPIGSLSDRIDKHADVAELVDALDLGSSALVA